MNISSCNAETHPIQLGDKLTIISSAPDAPNTIHVFAEKTGTIPYEVLVKLNEKIRRVII
jgi:alanine racemase